jgi:hypothetical protein
VVYAEMEARENTAAEVCRQRLAALLYDEVG